MVPGCDLYSTDPAQHLTAAVEELDYLDHDLSDLSVRGVRVPVRRLNVGVHLVV